MARPSQNKLSATTSTELPTLRSTPSLPRSITLSSLPPKKDPLLSGTGYAADDQMLDYQRQIKATLTNILNDERVKHNPDGTRCVQKILLENEQEMRKQRRHSLSTCTAKRTMLF